jgi:hypothetical protein
MAEMTSLFPERSRKSASAWESATQSPAERAGSRAARPAPRPPGQTLAFGPIAAISRQAVERHIRKEQK